MSESPGLVDFAIGLVNSVINLPDGQVNVFEEFKLQKNWEINLLIKTFCGLVVKMTFFAPCFQHTVRETRHLISTNMFEVWVLEFLYSYVQVPNL